MTSNAPVRPLAARADLEPQPADLAHILADRRNAARDREETAFDRKAARATPQSAYNDALTGVYTRELGLVMLDREIDHARRAQQPFTVVYIDVIGLKQINIRHGRGAGDALLRALGDALTTRLRLYDPVARVGGDEFVCGLGNADVDAARSRFEEVEGSIRGYPAGSIGAGFALLREDDTVEQVIARADLDLYRKKAAVR